MKGDENELVKIQCSYNAGAERRTLSFDGSIVYDPAHYWVIAGYEGRIRQATANHGSSRIAVKVSNEYIYTNDGFPILKRIEKRIDNPEKSYTSVDTYDFELSEGNVDAKEFALSAFGLPEPAGLGGETATRWYLWAIVLGVSCLSVAALLRWRARKKERPDETR
jgi:hypothetical protein